MLPPNLDLNHLRTLERLLATQSVTEAARNLGIGQPAMSKRLKQLREITADPLLVRRAGRTELTPHAESLVALVGDALAAIERALAPAAPFEAARARGKVTLAMGDETATAFVGPIMSRLQENAPFIDLRVRRLHRATTGLLDAGDIDFALVPDLREDPTFDMPEIDRFVFQPLYDEPYVVLSRTRRRWSMARYLASDHILVVPLEESDDGLVDQLLRANNQRRRVALSVPTFSAALRIVAETDLVATVPEVLCRVVAPKLFRAKPPLEIPCDPMCLVWHPRHTTDPRHQFLRQELRATITHCVKKSGLPVRI
ncbi:MAG: LysR family transcriptional regulator [Myxococcota bacterium]